MEPSASPLFSGYGVGALVSRLGHAKVRAVFTADGFSRRGRETPMKSVADEASEQLPSLEHMIVLKHSGLSVPWKSGRDHWWHELVDSAQDQAAAASTEAEDLLMILYTSGTTGKPKGAVHTHCSFPIKAAQDMAFGTDVHPGDVVHWYSDMGWMMGPWLVFGATLLGATCFIFDGSLDYPGPDRLWALVERHKINVLGISPTLIRTLIPHGEGPVRAHDLSSIHLFASTGEPWNPDPWTWLFDKVGHRQRPIINYSGGTEVGGGILMGNPLLPLKPTAFAAPCLGIAADVVNTQGMPLRDELGELIVRAPWIGMTRGFWQDDQRYLETYWSRFKGIWVHGDLAAVDADGMWYILGRSDDTLKVAGRRVGPAEIESVLVDHPAVSEAAAIGVPHPVKGSEVICFCVLVPNQDATAHLGRDLLEKVVHQLGKPLQPGRICFVRDLPKTRNSKVMRRIIRSAYLGEDEGDTSSLVNPEAIEPIRLLGQENPVA
ncbi:MAG: AMP-binding protein [Terriglobia bacterium]